MNFLDDIERDINKNWLYIEDKYFMFMNIVDNLIFLNKMNRKHKGEIGNVFYLQEYCTIRIDAGRQIGKTEYIKRRFKENDLIMVLKDVMKKTFIDYGIPDKNIVSARSFLYNKEVYMQKVYENIYVDEASYIFNILIDTDRLYQLLGKEEIEQTFIFMG